MWPASTRCLAVERPARPPPTTITFLGVVDDDLALFLISWTFCWASLKGADVCSRFGRGIPFNTVVDVEEWQLLEIGEKAKLDANKFVSAKMNLILNGVVELIWNDNIVRGESRFSHES